MDRTLAVVCGAPGVGKSTVARRAADRLDGSTLRTDVVRKELFAEPTYSASETDAVYAQLRERAADRLADGSVVLDGTFRTRDRRDRIARLAERTGAAFRLLVVRCDRTVVRDRLADRENDPSDADFAIHRRIADRFEPPAREHVVVDNSGSLAETRARVDELF